jgi:hypothetical protein
MSRSGARPDWREQWIKGRRAQARILETAGNTASAVGRYDLANQLWSAAAGLRAENREGRVVGDDPRYGQEMMQTSPDWVYRQPMRILDLAWDAYMNATVSPPENAPPNLVELSHSGITPASLSMLFDIAITAVLSAIEDGRLPCPHEGPDH